MKWDLFLLIASISMLLFCAIVGIAIDVVGSSNIAEELAHRIGGANEDILRSNLYDILESRWLEQTIVYCTPWAIFSVLLIVRIFTDKKQRDRGC